MECDVAVSYPCRLRPPVDMFVDDSVGGECEHKLLSVGSRRQILDRRIRQRQIQGLGCLLLVDLHHGCLVDRLDVLPLQVFDVAQPQPAEATEQEGGTDILVHFAFRLHQSLHLLDGQVGAFRLGAGELVAPLQKPAGVGRYQFAFERHVQDGDHYPRIYGGRVGAQLLAVRLETAVFQIIVETLDELFVHIAQPHILAPVFQEHFPDSSGHASQAATLRLQRFLVFLKPHAQEDFPFVLVDSRLPHGQLLDSFGLDCRRRLQRRAVLDSVGGSPFRDEVKPQELLRLPFAVRVGVQIDAPVPVRQFLESDSHRLLDFLILFLCHRHSLLNRRQR